MVHLVSLKFRCLKQCLVQTETIFLWSLERFWNWPFFHGIWISYALYTRQHHKAFLLGFILNVLISIFFSFQQAIKGTKLQKLHHAALSGNEEEVQKLLGKGVGKRKLWTLTLPKRILKSTCFHLSYWRWKRDQFLSPFMTKCWINFHYLEDGVNMCKNLSKRWSRKTKCGDLNCSKKGKSDLRSFSSIALRIPTAHKFTLD